MSVKTIKARIQDMICDARYTMKSTWAKTRLARLPDFKHDGLQTTFFFGSYPDPEVPLALQMGWQTGSPFSAEWRRVENTPQAVPKPGAIIFFDATKDNPYGHVAVVESASSKLLIIIEQNASYRQT